MGTAAEPEKRPQAPLYLREPANTFKGYLIIEIGMWLPVMWVACYRFQPAVRFYATPFGKRVTERGAVVLERWLPSMHKQLSGLAERIYGNPKGRTTAEWLLINKVLSPVAFPAKTYVGHLWCERNRKLRQERGYAE